MIRRLPVVLLVVSLVTASAAVAGDPELEARVDALEQKVIELQKQIETLKKLPATEPAQEKAVSIPVGDSPVLGNKQARVNVVVFSDLQCPFCARVHPILKEVAEDPDLRRRVNVVYKHFPLSFHPNAKPAALVAMAVRELGGDRSFWRFVDLVFENQRELGPDTFKRLADAAGVDGDRATMLAHAKEATYQATLDADQKLASSIGVRGTPTIFVGGWRLGTRSVESVKTLLDEKNLP